MVVIVNKGAKFVHEIPVDARITMCNGLLLVCTPNNSPYILYQDGTIEYLSFVPLHSLKGMKDQSHDDD